MALFAASHPHLWSALQRSLEAPVPKIVFRECRCSSPFPDRQLYQDATVQFGLPFLDLAKEDDQGRRRDPGRCLCCVFFF